MLVAAIYWTLTLYLQEMQTARVVGNATATVKHASMVGWKLLLVQPLKSDGGCDGDPVLAVDRLGAGPSETVIITSDGRGTREMLNNMNTPVRWHVMGIVD